MTCPNAMGTDSSHFLMNISIISFSKLQLFEDVVCEVATTLSKAQYTTRVYLS